MRLELETSRLRLQPCRLEDIELVRALWTNERVRRFLFDGRVISPDEARSFVAASLAKFEQYGYGLWLVFARGAKQFVGFLRSEEGVPYLIYGIHPDFWNGGCATEAAGAVLSYAFDSPGLAQVKADVDEPNVESVRVLEKLGMKRVNRAVVDGRTLLYFERRPAENAV